MEETECLADCNIAPCVQVNHRFVRTTTPETFDALVGDLRGGRRDHDIPIHGTLIRVRRAGGLRATRDDVAKQRTEAKAARERREEEKA